MKSGFFLDVIVRQCTPIFQLLAGKDQTLLIRRNTLFVLNLGLDVIDGIGRLDLKGDGFAGQCLDDCDDVMLAIAGDSMRIS